MSRMREGKEALEGRGAWMRTGDREDASALADSARRGSSACSVPLSCPGPQRLGRSRWRGWPASPGQLAPYPPPAVPVPCSRHVEKLRCWPALRPVAQGLDGSLSDSSLLPSYPRLFGLACCSGSRTPECCPASSAGARDGGEGKGEPCFRASVCVGASGRGGMHSCPGSLCPTAWATALSAWLRRQMRMDSAVRKPLRADDRRL